MKKTLSPIDLETITRTTLDHYESHAEDFWIGTKDHDVTQNYAAFLGALPQKKGLRILDLGCGPGRDLLYFHSLGHLPTGLDGSASFCKMARTICPCRVLQQNFLSLKLASASFDGVFANASMFHVPSQELPRVLSELRESLVEGGILFMSNPRGAAEGWSGERYGHYCEWEGYQELLKAARFTPLTHYYRPSGLPRHEQPWLAIVSRAV